MRKPLFLFFLKPPVFPSVPYWVDAFFLDGTGGPGRCYREEAASLFFFSQNPPPREVFPTQD